MGTGYEALPIQMLPSTPRTQPRPEAMEQKRQVSEEREEVGKCTCKALGAALPRAEGPHLGWELRLGLGKRFSSMPPSTKTMEESCLGS